MIDHTCHQMKNTSRNINIHGGVEKLDPNISIPETWAENSNCNIQSSQSITFLNSIFRNSFIYSFLISALFNSMIYQTKFQKCYNANDYFEKRNVIRT